MKCATCGWLLSPHRPTATCPRCGSPVEGGQKSAISSAGSLGSAQANQATWGGNGAFGSPAQIVEQSQGSYSAPTLPNNFQSPTYQAPLSPLSPPVEPWQAGASTPVGYTLGRPGYGNQPPRKNSNPKLGFIVAGLCIVTGALLLVFVYFMAVDGQGNPSGSASSITPAASSPTVAASPSPTTPSPTATTYPGQQYIDNAQMSSSPPPLQASTTFKTGQKIYVAFHLHPHGQKGVVCLTWYLNGQKATAYNFPVGSGETSTYAFAIFGQTGPGYVQLYWASDTSCSNEQLAQSVNFTVTK
ncbi:MAG TPA: hypothetical protein VKT25_07980 [Ktedonobacteraceae bacterium]|nr:hypothetical protein [Ktedonobacteraceae bacterium]